MNNIDNGGFAFPTTNLPYADDMRGMTLRDWFAGQALAGLLACNNTAGKAGDFASDAYDYADAMLKARGGA